MKGLLEIACLVRPTLQTPILKNCRTEKASYYEGWNSCESFSVVSWSTPLLQTEISQLPSDGFPG